MALTFPPKNLVRRRNIAGMEGMWTKMWDPPEASPVTPEPVAPDNPVPAFMTQQLPGVFSANIPNTHRRGLRNTLSIPTWDGAKNLFFMAFDDPDIGAGNGRGAQWPGPTFRVPRGVIFHCETQATGGPHTIHWHGIEPTPMNDGVGHCSTELGVYTYQWQPNFIGTYFYHCHRNTVQHFEFGLYGMLLIEPPDAYDPNIPNVEDELTKNVGGYPRRTAASLASFPQFPGYVAGDATFGVAGALDAGVGDPHAFTVPYDVEALWVLDDRDSVWSDLANDHFSFFPGGSATQSGPLSDPLSPVIVLPVRPGVDDQFPKGFFHDYNADYWFVTGQPVPAARGGIGTVAGGIVIPPELNGGVTGMRVDVDAQVGQTVLIRVLNAAYNTAEVTFPVDVVIIAWDGRALGVPPFGRYSQPQLLPAGTPVRFSTARRFDALVRATTPTTAGNSFATARFFETRGENPATTQAPLMTARIPFVINA